MWLISQWEILDKAKKCQMPLLTRGNDDDVTVGDGITQLLRADETAHFRQGLNVRQTGRHAGSVGDILFHLGEGDSPQYIQKPAVILDQATYICISLV